MKTYISDEAQELELEYKIFCDISKSDDFVIIRICDITKSLL